jgi:hypothetical protein
MGFECEEVDARLAESGGVITVAARLRWACDCDAERVSADEGTPAGRGLFVSEDARLSSGGGDGPRGWADMDDRGTGPNADGKSTD